MRYIAEKYERQLHDLAALLAQPLGEVAAQPLAEVCPIPTTLTLRNPPEHGWDYTPPEAA